MSALKNIQKIVYAGLACLPVAFNGAAAKTKPPKHVPVPQARPLDLPLRAHTCTSGELLGSTLAKEDYRAVFYYAVRESGTNGIVTSPYMIFGRKEDKAWLTVHLNDSGAACVYDTGKQLQYKTAINAVPVSLSPPAVSPLAPYAAQSAKPKAKNGARSCANALIEALPSFVVDSLTLQGKSDDGSYLYVFADGQERPTIIYGTPREREMCGLERIAPIESRFMENEIGHVFGNDNAPTATPMAPENGIINPDSRDKGYGARPAPI